jgi:tRNA (Thr-GGU) A37 N-methylase
VKIGGDSMANIPFYILFGKKNDNYFYIANTNPVIWAVDIRKVKPFMDNNTHGVFATRSPKRPNRIGMSVVKVTDVKDNIVYIENVDILDGTPLLDIKPYVPQLYEDTIDKLKIGWFETKHQKAKSQKSDDRFK